MTRTEVKSVKVLNTVLACRCGVQDSVRKRNICRVTNELFDKVRIYNYNIASAILGKEV